MNVASVERNDGAVTAVRADLARLEEASGQLVGRMFYGTLLKQMRESPLAGTIGHGGRGEAVFAAQLHDIYAERLGTTTQGGLKEALYDSLKRQQERLSSGRHQAMEARP